MIIEITCKRIPAEYVYPRRLVIWFWRVVGEQRQGSYDSIVYEDQSA